MKNFILWQNLPYKTFKISFFSSQLLITVWEAMIFWCLEFCLPYFSCNVNELRMTHWSSWLSASSAANFFVEKNSVVMMMYNTHSHVRHYLIIAVQNAKTCTSTRIHARTHGQLCMRQCIKSVMYVLCRCDSKWISMRHLWDASHVHSV